jgi:predicted small integral membrane protein
MEILSLLGIGPAQAQNSAGWGNVAKEAEAKGFSFTDPLFGGTWMAWTGATALVFVGIFSAMFIITILEIRRPGGDERRGVLGLTTTRGDRLFITLLGTAYIFLAWLGIMGMPLWAPLAISIGWGVFCFWKV